MNKKILLLVILGICFSMSAQAYIVSYALWQYRDKKILILDDAHYDMRNYGNKNVMESILQLNLLDLAVQHWRTQNRIVDTIIEFERVGMPYLGEACYHGTINEFIKIAKEYPRNSSVKVICMDYRQASQIMVNFSKLIYWVHNLVNQEVKNPHASYMREYREIYNFVKNHGLTMRNVMDEINGHYRSIVTGLVNLRSMQPKLKSIQSIIHYLNTSELESLEDIFGLALLASIDDKKRACDECGVSNNAKLVWQKKIPKKSFVRPLQVVKHLCDLVVFLGDFSFISGTYQCLQQSNSSIIVVLCGLAHGNALKEFLRGIHATPIESFKTPDYHEPIALEKLEVVLETLK